MTPNEITLFVYNISLIPIIFFSVLFILLSLLNILMAKEKKNPHKKMDKLPFISVQIPTYNDPVAERCIRHCMDFNYPKDKYEIIIADDSTNLETQAILKDFADKNPGFIKYIHRGNREGYKAGALKNAMKITKGEFIIIFDSDWMPEKNFMKEIIQPFSDPKVAIVQTRQGFYNKNTNLITRFAAYVLMLYHTIVMPINNKINCVFFCGTAGAIRRSMFEEVGGWNLNSLTEDSELTVNLLLKGYKSVYLDIETLSEVPETFEGFLKQQMRWCYGNARVFLDNAHKIISKKGLTIKQRLMIMYITLGNIIAPVVIVMTLFGFLGWFLGDLTLINFGDIVELVTRVALTGGFLVIGFLTLYKRKLLREFPYMVLTLLTMGIVLAAANSIAFIKAVTNKKLHWYCTPKIENDKFA
jgi:cellulose synthase/poly-beta-1,6-N-acetylglucosamine synthase-like glycosyltransferase